jgi:replicative DNA helicase
MKKDYSKSLENYMLPGSKEVEEVVLGTLLIDSLSIDRIISNFSENLFLKPQNRLIAVSIINLYKKSIPVDLVTVVKDLIYHENLGNAGGSSYIASLTNRVASSNNIDYHIKILQQEALRRKLIEIGHLAVSKSLDNTEDIFDVFNETQSKLDNSLKDVVNYEIKRVGSIHEDLIKQSMVLLNSGRKSGVPTGLTMVDNVTNGWQKSDLIILAGRPGMGKTTAAVSMCIYPAILHKIPVAFFSLEMSNEQVVSRMQSFLSGVNVSKIVKKQMNEEEINQVQINCKELNDAPIFIDDTPNISLLELKGKCRKMVKENKIELVVVDYLQLMRSGLKTRSREEEIAEISRGLKSLAKELNIPVIALSQLSRNVESRSDKKPMLQDLRESGQIEQDADMVVFCYRPEYYGIDQYEVGTSTFGTDGLFMLLVAKHRNGELGEVPLTFIAQQTKLTNYNENYRSLKINEEISSTFVQQSKAIQPNDNFFAENSVKEEELPF